MLKIYLDTCCFNRPYDDQSLMRNSLEAQAISHIQSLIQRRRFLLATSYILLFENSKNPYALRKVSIENYIRKYSSIYIGSECQTAVSGNAHEIMKTGLKKQDAYHVACAMFAGCGYFLSTDDRVLKYLPANMKIVNPVDFLRMEVERQ